MLKYFIPAIALFLAACGPSQPIPLPAAQQSVFDANSGREGPMQQPQQQPSDNSLGAAALGAVAGGAIGYMAGKAADKRVYNEGRSYAPDYDRRYNYGRSYGSSTTTTTVVKRGLFGKRTITRSITRRR